MNHTAFTAIVLAGQRPGVDPVAHARGVTYKALAPVGGRAMILNVLDALEASPWVGNVFISLEDRDLANAEPRLKDYLASGRIADAGTSICTSVASAIEQKGITPPILVVTADHALLTVDMLDGFCRDAVRLHREEALDFALAMVARRLFRATYPDARRTFIPFRDDGYSGCNLFAFMTPAAHKVLDFWGRIERERKKPWRLIRAFGIGNLLRYLLRLEDLQGMMIRAGKVIGIRGRAIVLLCPEAAIDVDTVEDLKLVEEILAARAEFGEMTEVPS